MNGRPSRDDRRRPQGGLRINNRIRVPEIRVIGDDGGQLGVLPTHEALRLAEEKGLDLVEISPRAFPPVCRIMDYGKYKYEMSKKASEQRAASKSTEMKEIRLGRSVKIDKHDIGIRVDQARRFLMAGHKVMITQKFKGREIAHKELGIDNLRFVADELIDLCRVEQTPRWFGKQASIIVAPDKVKVEAVKRKLEKERKEAIARGEKVAAEKTIAQLEAELAAEKHDDDDDDHDQEVISDVAEGVESAPPQEEDKA